MTVDPDPLVDRRRTLDQSDLEMLNDDREDLEAVADIGGDVKDLLGQ